MVTWEEELRNDLAFLGYQKKDIDAMIELAKKYFHYYLQLIVAMYKGVQNERT